MSFDREHNKKRGGKRPPQKPPAKPTPRPVLEEKPMLLPSIEPPKARIGREEKISGLEHTIPSEDIQILRDPSHNFQRQAQPSPVPRSQQPMVVETQEGQPSEVVIKAENYQSRLQSIKVSAIAPDDKLSEIQSLFAEARQEFEAMKREPGISTEHLEFFNGVIGDLLREQRELKDHIKFKANQAAGVRQAGPPPIPIEVPKSPTPMPVSTATAQPMLAVSDEPVEPAKEGPSAFRRFITSPVTWAVVNASAFTALLFQQNFFKKMAEGIGGLPKTKTPSIKATVIVYGAVLLGSLAVTGLVNYLRNRSAEKKLQNQQQNGGPAEHS